MSHASTYRARLSSLRPPIRRRFAFTAAMRVGVALLSASLAVTACSRKVAPYQAEVKNQRVTSAPAKKPSMVYVTDFEVDSPTTAPSGSAPRPPGPLGAVLDRVRDQEDPVQHARKLVDLMARSLVSDLQSAGVPAQRLLPGAPTPRDGWIVRGVVTEMNQGNRLQRAVVGFGAGESDVQLVVNVAELSERPVDPFYSFDAGAASGKMPGGAITLNPYAVAAKFVLSRNATEREVTETASKIAKEIATHAHAAPRAPASD